MNKWNEMSKGKPRTAMLKKTDQKTQNQKIDKRAKEEPKKEMGEDPSLAEGLSTGEDQDDHETPETHGCCNLSQDAVASTQRGADLQAAQRENTSKAGR